MWSLTRSSFELDLSLKFDGIKLSGRAWTYIARPEQGLQLKQVYVYTDVLKLLHRYIQTKEQMLILTWKLWWVMTVCKLIMRNCGTTLVELAHLTIMIFKHIDKMGI